MGLLSILSSMSSTINKRKAENITEELSEDEVMQLVRRASDRIVSNIDQSVDDDINTEDYQVLLLQDDPRAVIKAHKKAKEDGIETQFKQSFKRSLDNALDDPAGWLQVLLTASLAA